MKTSSLTVATGIVLCAWNDVAEAVRRKRFMFISSTDSISVGFLLIMPVSLALRTLTPIRGRPFSHESSSSYKDQDPAEDLFWDSAYEQQLTRLSTYFDYLELTQVVCQERLVCELASDPVGFSPIAEIFLKELRLVHGPVKTTKDSLMWRYVAAAREGFTGSIEDCSKAYPTCSLGANRILDIAVMKVWQYIASKLNLQLV